MVLFAVHTDICFMALPCQWLSFSDRCYQWMPWQPKDKRSDFRKRTLLEMDLFALLSRETISCYSKSPVANLWRLSNPWLSVWVMDPIVQAAKHPEPDPAKLLSMCFILGMQENSKINISEFSICLSALVDQGQSASQLAGWTSTRM